MTYSQGGGMGSNQSEENENTENERADWYRNKGADVGRK